MALNRSLGALTTPAVSSVIETGLIPSALHFQEQPFQIADALAEEHVAAARAARGAVPQPDVQQPLLHERETLGRRHALLRPQAGVDADAEPFAFPGERSSAARPAGRCPP